MKQLLAVMLMCFAFVPLCSGMNSLDYAFAKAEFKETYSQYPKVDFKTAQVDLYINENSEIISGTVIYNLAITADTQQVILDAKNLTRYDVLLNGTPTNADYDQQYITVSDAFKKGTTYELTVEFASDPNQALYHIDRDGDGKWDQIWTQGQGKYTSNWLPSIDDVNDKIEWDMTVSAPSIYQVATNGKLIEKTPLDDYTKWVYDMKQPMSSYLVALVVGEYKIKETSSDSGIPIDLYYYPEDAPKVESTYKHTVEMFNFLELELGMPYPWQVYRQIPVKDFLYSGMENTTTTIFNDQFMVDPIAFNDANYETVNAHELAHQWFGDLVTAQSGKHHWLQEGFATYYAMLAERSIYGDDHYYMQLYTSAEQLISQNQNGSTTSLLNPKASSLTFYQRGAWALHALRDKVGEFRFRESVNKYLNRYQYDSVTTDDFLDIVATVSGKDLREFKSIWLESNEFPKFQALRLLRKSDFMEQYFQLSARRISSFDEAKNSYKETLREPINDFMLEEMVAQLSIHNDDRVYELYKKAAASGSIKGRQAVALSLQQFQPELEPLLRSMLNDPSYLTRERALYLLWSGLPDQRNKILRDADQQWNSKTPSLDMAWIAMALNSSDFKTGEKYKYLERIGTYTSPIYDTETRLAAFDYLISLKSMSTQNYKDLMDASMHHSWRFYKQCRDILKALYKKDEHRPLIKKIMETLPEEKQKRIETILLG